MLIRSDDVEYKIKGEIFNACRISVTRVSAPESLKVVQEIQTFSSVEMKHLSGAKMRQEQKIWP